MRSAKIELALEPALATGVPKWTNPVVPGDHPDPTIIRVDGVYWASATSGEWSPQFPLFRSTDLANWRPAGSVFPQQPAWAEGSFWAPELVHDESSNRFFVWYVGQKRGGPLCIAVATADAPGGPYTDHGPLICEVDGSIDPCFARDEEGAPYLIWKEDGNSRGWPTPIWAQRLSDDLLRLTGEKTMLIVNDQGWEEGVVEGPYIFRHEQRFYMFYAGNACCGRECKYAEGVARADRLLGPWEKYPANPLIGANDRWRCPGHGTAVKSDAGSDYLLYHAYPEGGTIYVGREAVLDEIAWPAKDAEGREGWPSVNSGRGPGEYAKATPIDFRDDFSGPEPGPAWQWPVNTRPEISTGGEGLVLRIPPMCSLSERPVESAILAVPRPAGKHYQATIALKIPESREPGLWAGLAVIGDPFNTIGLGLRGKADGTGFWINLWQRRGAMQAVVWEAEAPAAEKIWLRSVTVRTPHHLQFLYSVDGVKWQEAGGEYDASDLPAWDRALRIGMLLEGPRGLSATFEAFRLKAR